MGDVWDDERVCRGMRAQLAKRRDRIAAGERPVGWKVAFGAPGAQERLGINGPLVGFLTDRSLVDSGAVYPIGAFTKAALEPEIAVHLGDDVAPGSDRPSAARSIAGLGPAIELADVDHDLGELERIVATNIFHRAVVLGPADPERAGAAVAGLEVEVLDAGTPIASTPDPTALVGDLVDIVRHVADYLGAFGERLRAGEVVITGSTVPLIHPHPGADITYRLTPLPPVSVRLTA